jgi:hypothetical protein
MNTPVMPSGERAGALAALSGLLLLSAAMTAAAMAGLPPHPPSDKLPFVSTNAALAVMSLVLLGLGRARAGGALALLTALAYVPSVGLHKFWTEPHAMLLTPVLVVGSGAVLALAWCGVLLLRRG